MTLHDNLSLLGLNLTSCKLDLTKMIFFTSDSTKHQKTRKTHTISKFQFSEDVDPVHLFLSLSSESEFRRKPLPIALSAVACIIINL